MLVLRDRRGKISRLISDTHAKILRVLIENQKTIPRNENDGFSSYKIRQLGVPGRTFEINRDFLLDNNLIKIVTEKKRGKQNRIYYDLTPLGLISYLSWVFPETDSITNTLSTEEPMKIAWNSIAESRKKFNHRNLRRFSPLIERHWKAITDMGIPGFWKFGVAFGGLNLEQQPLRKNDLFEGFLGNYTFAFSVPFFDNDNKYPDTTFEIKFSKIIFLCSDDSYEKLTKTNDLNTNYFNYESLGEKIADTVTFLFFFHIITEERQYVHMWRIMKDNFKKKKHEKNIDELIKIINNDIRLKEIINEHLALLTDKIKPIDSLELLTSVKR